MGELGDRLDAMVVQASSPDGQINVSVRGQGELIDIAFRAGAYRRYREEELAHQLSRLATLAFTRYRREEQEIIDAAFGESVNDELSEYGAERRRYNEALERLTAVGASGDGAVQVRTVGLVTWTVSIAPGTLDRCTEQEFLAEARTAVGALLARYQAGVLALKDEIYDFGYPDSVRRAAGVSLRGSAS